MKLIDLLRTSNDSDLRTISKSIGFTEQYQIPLLISRIEQTIKSPKHIDFIVSSSRPPILAIFQVILSKANFQSEINAFREEVIERHRELTSLVTEKKLVPLKEHELYRKILMEAWRNDLRIDANELSLLNVLRQELGISLIDHYLLSQHEELSPSYHGENTFESVFNNLKENGLFYISSGEVFMPADIANLVRESIGMYIDSSKFIRLLELISSESLSEALEKKKLAVSGTKQEKISRLIENFIAPFDVLTLLTIDDLRNLAETVGCKKSGTKDDLISRLVTYFHNDDDLYTEDNNSSVAQVEEKQLNEEKFIELFSGFETSTLILIASKNDSRRKTGSKLDIVKSLWNLPISESSILSSLSNDDLRSELRKRNQASLGSKQDLIQRLIAYSEARNSAK